MTKRFITKTLSILIAVEMLLALLPAGIISVSAATASNGTCGDNLTWELDSAGNLTISGTGDMYDYSSLSGKAPWGMGIKSVVINAGATSIGKYAFYHCTGLTSVTIPDSVTVIGDYAFEDCTGLTSVTIPDSVTSIGRSAFYNTGYYNNESNWEDGVLYIGKYLIKARTSISGIYAGRRIVGIADYAFENCSGLSRVMIREGVTSIGRSAFSGCYSLTSVTIPASVTSIGDSAFSYCAGLEAITVAENNPVYHSAGNCLIETESKTLIAGCKNSVIPTDGSVTNTGRYAFYRCIGLTSVTIPDSVTSIGKYAFYHCTGLTSVTIPDSVTVIGDYAFEDCTGLTSVTIPDSVTSIGRSAFYNTGYYNNESNWEDGVLYIGKWLIRSSISGSYAIKEGTVGIGDYAFYGCTGLTSVTIPDSVTSIGDRAFYDCTGLTSVTIGSGVTSIGEYAFFDCTGLTSVNITDIEALCRIRFSGYYSNPLYYAHNLFLNGELVTDLVIPDSVTSIGDYAFYYCASLTSVTIGSGVTSIGRSAFRNCYRLTSVTIPDSVTSIGVQAFSGCTGLMSITIPDSMTSIGDAAFDLCTSLMSVNITDIAAWCGIQFCSNPLNYAHNLFLNGELVTDLVIPDSVTSIGDYAFLGCYRLSSITIPDSVTSIGVGAFSGCKGLTSVTIPDGVTSIGDRAFYDCTGLTSVTIGSGVTSVGYDAFYNCTGLKELITGMPNANGLRVNTWRSVTLLDSVTSIGEGAFRNCYGLTSVTIPNSVTSIGNSVFYGCTGLTSITIPNSVRSISGNAFFGCTRLTSVTIPDSVTSIGYDAFYGCTGLTSVTIPDSVTSISEYAFHYINGSLDVRMCVYKNSYAFNYAVKYGFSYEFIKPSRIAITILPYKLICLEGEQLNLTGGVITAYYDNETSEELEMTADMISGFDNTVVGPQTLAVTYEGQTATFNVEIIAKSLTGMRVTSLPTNRRYIEYKGGLDLDGGEITLYYNNDTTETMSMTSDMVSGFDIAMIGVQTLTVTYGGFEATFNVEVVAKSIAGIAVITLPEKLRYLVGKDPLDISGGAVMIYFDNDTTREAYMVYNNGQPNLMFADDFSVAPFTVSGFDNRFAGVCTVTVAYQGCSAAFDVEIVDKELSGVSVAKAPNKTVYEVGETLDLTGGRIVLSYNNDTCQYANLITVAGVTRMVIEGESASREVSVSGFDSRWGGVKTVVITYEGMDVSFNVTVSGDIHGDLDGDGIVTVVDALASLRVAMGLGVIEDMMFESADIDGDGVITVSDALRMLRLAAGLPI